MYVMKDHLEYSDQDGDDTHFRLQHTVRTPGQRDPERTKRAILESATAEFMSKGFAGASVNEIAARANVNKRMLYHYFGKKDQLYVAVLEQVYTSLRAAQVQLNLTGQAPKEAIERLIRFTWDYYLQHPEFLSLLMMENLQDGEYVLRSERIRHMNAPFLDILDTVLKRGQAEGVFREDVDALQLYLTIASLGGYFVAARFTLSNLLDKELASVSGLQARLRHIVEVVLGYLRP
jgi:AcrR family transcriptional regulator